MTPLHHPLYHPAPELSRIPHNRPAGGVLVDGPTTAELERRWCELTGMNDAATVGSGTAALRLALLALGVGPGDEVIVPAYSCVALLNAPLAVGAVPVLADVEAGTWTLDPLDAIMRRTPRTAAVITVNLFGVPAELAFLHRCGVPIIEDCSHGPILGRGDLSISSFYATKLVGAGMGGIVAAHSPAVIRDVRDRRDYGDQPPDGRNLNDKITEHAASLALAELDNLPAALAERASLASNYSALIAESPLSGRLLAPAATEGRVWYRYTLELPERLTAARVVEAMKQAGVDAEQPVWDLRGCRYWTQDLPVASEAFDRLISLPLYPGLTETEQERVVQALAEAVR